MHFLGYFKQHFMKKLVRSLYTVGQDTEPADLKI
jgi:hypothetical protein